MGAELAAAVVGSVLLGYWIDLHYGTSPWAVLICSLLGLVGGLYNLIRQAVHETFLPKDRAGDKDGRPPAAGER
jgi:F0F1-type ATP synthase assembly protein I